MRSLGWGIELAEIAELTMIRLFEWVFSSLALVWSIAVV
jgi:hypothetical protein